MYRSAGVSLSALHQREPVQQRWGSLKDMNFCDWPQGFEFAVDLVTAVPADMNNYDNHDCVHSCFYSPLLQYHHFILLSPRVLDLLGARLECEPLAMVLSCRRRR